MLTGYKVARSCWNGKNMWIAIQSPDEYSKMTKPCIYIKTVKNDLIPWLPNQEDMLAVDWNIVD